MIFKSHILSKTENQTHIRSVILQCSCTASPFNIILEMSVNWGQQLLDFLGVGCCSIRVWWRVLAAQQSWLFFVLLLVSWCSRCFHWWKIRTAGRPVQHLTLLLWSCAPGIGGVVNCVHWQSFLEVFLLQLLVFGTTWFSLLLTCFWYCIVNKI